MSQYPEHDKMETVQDEARAVSAFLEWLIEERGVTLCRDDGRGRLEPFPVNIESLLAGHFKINLSKIDAEKEQMLQDLRTANEQARAGVVESRGRTADTP